MLTLGPPRNLRKAAAVLARGVRSVARRLVPRKNRSLWMTVLSQYAAVGIGSSLALLAINRFPPEPWSFLLLPLVLIFPGEIVMVLGGSLACFGQAIWFASRAKPSGIDSRALLPLCLGLYGLALLAMDPFVGYGDSSFVIHVQFLVPLLLAMGPLVRMRAWAALAGVFEIVIACTVVIALAHHSVLVSGFYHREIS